MADRVAEIIRAIRETGGNVSAVADAFGKSRKWFYEEAAKHSEIQAALEDTRGKMTDKARDNVRVAIEGGDLDVSKWALARLDPEFSDKASFESKGEHKVIVEVVRK